MIKRRAEARYVESRHMWEIIVQKDGERKAFRLTDHKRSKKGKHAVEARADEWLDNGTNDMRFGAAWEQFLAYQRDHASLSGWKKHESIGRLYILPTVRESRKLTAITPLIWQKCIDAAADAGLSQRSCVNVRASIVSFYHFCRRARLDVGRLEEGDLTIPKTASAARTKTVLQPDAIRKLFEDPSIIYYGKRQIATFSYAWQFAVVTGLRRGELAGLKNTDIKDGQLHVARSINYLGEETDGKNQNARRTIELTPTALGILAKQRAMLMERGIVSPWVFPDRWGERPNPNCIYDQWRSWCKQHDIDMSMHELRHTFISLGKTDLPLQLMKAVVGHSSSMDTYGTYGHEIDGERHQAAEIIENVFQRILHTEE